MTPGAAGFGVQPQVPPGGPRPVAPKAPVGVGAAQPVAKSSLTKILDEQPLRVSIVLDVIKVTRKPVPAPPR